MYQRDEREIFRIRVTQELRQMPVSVFIRENNSLEGRSVEFERSNFYRKMSQ